MSCARALPCRVRQIRRDSIHFANADGFANIDTDDATRIHSDADCHSFVGDPGDGDADSDDRANVDTDPNARTANGVAHSYHNAHAGGSTGTHANATSQAHLGGCGE